MEECRCLHLLFHVLKDTEQEQEQEQAEEAAPRFTGKLREVSWDRFLEPCRICWPGKGLFSHRGKCHR